MANVRIGIPKAMLISGAALLGICLAFLTCSATGARASESVYCNNQTLGRNGNCSGAPRTFYAVYGWGDQHSVCVAATGSPGAPAIDYVCSGGPGQGAYSPIGHNLYAYPFIANNASGSNTVHGIAYQP